MKIDLTNCKTPEDVERALKPLGDLMSSLRSRVAEALATKGTTVIDGGIAAGRSGGVAASLKVGRITVRVVESREPATHLRNERGTRPLCGSTSRHFADRGVNLTCKKCLRSMRSGRHHR